MSEVLQLTDVAVRVVEITETLVDVTVKFERCDWVLTRGEDDEMTFDYVEPGSPGAKYTQTGEYFSLRFGELDGLAINGHYRMRLDEIPGVDQDDEL